MPADSDAPLRDDLPPEFRPRPVYRGRPAQRCHRCAMVERFCLCADIQPFATRCRLVLYLHRLELKRTTNTGRLLLLALTNSEVILRGVTPEAGALEHDGARRDFVNAFVLYPYDDALELTAESAARLCEHGPPTLIVPDGNWRQSSKIAKREPSLQGLRRLRLPLDAAGDSIYTLRRRHRDDGLCTLEAAARAMELIENAAGGNGSGVRRALEGLLRKMVERTITSRNGSRPARHSQAVCDRASGTRPIPPTPAPKPSD